MKHTCVEIRWTDGQTDGRTNDGEFNSPPSSRSEGGGQKVQCSFASMYELSTLDIFISW